MPTKRRQQKRAEHEAKRKAKRRTLRQRAVTGGKRAMLIEALSWPVLECWINEEWQDPMQINQVVVVRHNPLTDEVRVGIYLVDRACLGVKNAHAANFFSLGEFRREMLTPMSQEQKLIQVDFDLAAAVVKAGLEYAAPLGFRPHKDYRDASILLQDADPGAVKEEIPVGGPDGKPFFVAGPYDNAKAIVAKLARELGPGNFDYLVPIEPDAEFVRAADWDEEDGVIDGDDIGWLLDDEDEDGAE